MCPIAGVVIVIVIALVIGCPIMKLVNRRNKAKTATMAHNRADSLYDRAQNTNLTGRKEGDVNS